MANNAAEVNFPDYFETWVSELEDLLAQLTQAKTSAADPQALVARVTTHIKAYYTAKWAAARHDVHAFYCPTWLSPLELAFQWMTGWKPSSLFRLVDSLQETGLKSLTEAQAKRIAELRTRIRLEEDKVEREMERQQVAVADRQTVELIKRLAASAADPSEVKERVGRMVAGLEQVMKSADFVRLKALRGVLDELSPAQSVEFLAEHAKVLVRIRHLGQTRALEFAASHSSSNV